MVKHKLLNTTWCNEHQLLNTAQWKICKTTPMQPLWLHLGVPSIMKISLLHHTVIIHKTCNLNNCGTHLPPKTTHFIADWSQDWDDKILFNCLLIIYTVISDQDYQSHLVTQHLSNLFHFDYWSIQILCFKENFLTNHCISRRTFLVIIEKA